MPSVTSVFLYFLLEPEYHVRLLHEAGGVTDARSYDACARILHEELGIKSVVLHSNNPQKHAAVAAVFGPERVHIECMPATVTPDNAKYLAEKVRCLAHDGRLLSEQCRAKHAPRESDSRHAAL